MQQVGGGSVLNPGGSTILGPCRVIPKEYPGIFCRSADVDLPALAPGQNGSSPEWKRYLKAADSLAREGRADASDPTVAWRGGKRWVQTYEPVKIDSNPPGSRLRERGVYLLTGGLGAIGMAIARCLPE